MDKEDYIQVLLSVLRKPQWKRSSSVTDWDLKAALRKAGFLATPEQMSALLCEIKKRGLVTGQVSRHDARGVAMWGLRITKAGEEWLSARDQAGPVVPAHPVPGPTSPGGAQAGSYSGNSAPSSAQQA